MMDKHNYQLEFEKILQTLSQRSDPPTLLLHSCCGPCSSSVLEKLTDVFRVTIYYYNPNIYPDLEYQRRWEEQQQLLEKLTPRYSLAWFEGTYRPEDFYDQIRGLEQIPEGGERCFRCYELRLQNTAETAKRLNFEFFTTTLSVSPHKNSAKLNEIGKKLAEQYGVNYLYSDFKKKNGYKRSLELSAVYGLYRQDYCGCVYSWQERQQHLANQQQNHNDLNKGN